MNRALFIAGLCWGRERRRASPRQEPEVATVCMVPMLCMLAYHWTLCVIEDACEANLGHVFVTY